MFKRQEVPRENRPENRKGIPREEADQLRQLRMGKKNVDISAIDRVRRALLMDSTNPFSDLDINMAILQGLGEMDEDKMLDLIKLTSRNRQLAKDGRTTNGRTLNCSTCGSNSTELQDDLEQTTRISCQSCGRESVNIRSKTRHPVLHDCTQCGAKLPNRATRHIGLLRRTPIIECPSCGTRHRVF